MHSRNLFLKNKCAITTLAVFTITIAQFTVMLYTPSFPAIVKYFHTHPGTIQASVSVILFSFSLSAILYGTLSDHFGRRPCMLISILIVLAGTLVVIFSKNVYMFLLGRLIQGLGTGGPSVLIRAILRDNYDGKHLARAMSSAVMIFGITPAIAPCIGGYIQAWFGWQGNFVFLFIYVLISFIAMLLFFPETNTQAFKHELSPKKIFKNLRSIVSCNIFLIFAFLVLFGYSSQIICLTIAPFVFQSHLGLAPEKYGWIILVPSIGFILGGMISRPLHHFFHISSQILFGIIILLISGLALLSITFFSNFTVISTIIPMITAFFAVSFIFSNGTTGVMSPFPEKAGTAAAASGFIQLLGTSLLGGFVSIFHSTTPTIIATVFVANSCVMLILWFYLIKLEKNKRIKQEIDRAEKQES
jgi:MFS transporter, DHA1 family, 2-module integral membrane pump EmrD